jgi:hypothetical protein
MINFKLYIYFFRTILYLQAIHKIIFKYMKFNVSSL